MPRVLLPPMTTSTQTRGNPLIRISLSLALLGLALFMVIKFGKAPKKVPVVPSFRSQSPSSEGGGSFAWIPRYPGASVINIRTKENESVLSYGLDFQSSDAPADIASYFDRGLRGAGLTVQTRNPSADESNLHAESSDKKRTIDVGIDKTPTGSRVTVSALEQ
jgi:hypothetical protein